jgi:hypothetical protein
MHKKIHSTHTPYDHIKKTKRVLEEKGVGELFPILSKAFSMLDDELTNIYRIYRLGDEDEAGGGGVGGDTPQPLQKKVVPKVILPEIVFETTKMYVPTHEVMDTLGWGRKNKRIFIPVMYNLELEEILGSIWVETNTHGDPDNRHQEETHQYYVRLLHTGLGSIRVRKGMLLGFDVGFRRYAPNRGKFFMDIFEFSKESTNVNPADITWEIPVTGRKFESDEVILPSDLVDAYNTKTGGPGLKLRTYLTISARINE